MVRFSCPSNASPAGGDGEGDVMEFPESVLLLKARLTGLLGETRAARDCGFADAAFGLPERSESLTAERKGVDRTVWECWCDNCGAEAGGIGRCITRQGDGELGVENALSELWE